MERGKPTRQTSLIIDPPNGRLPPLTPEEQKLRKEARGGKGFPGEWRGEADSYDDLNIYYRCITRGVLGSIIPVVYNNGNEILQAPGLVIIRNEMIHETRVIPLDGRPHLSSAIRQYLGDSRGHWEGNTLVIETTNFTDKDAIGSNGAGYPGDPGHHSADLKLTERLTRVDEDTLNYQATIDDPKTWTQPWTILISLKRDDNYQLLEYACHEGNYRDGRHSERRPRGRAQGNEIRLEIGIEFQNRKGVRMRTRLAMLAAGVGLLLMLTPAVGASRVSSGVRQGQAGAFGWHGHRDGMDQSARLDSHRREESGRHRHQLDGGMRQPQHHAAPRVHQAVARSGHGDWPFRDIRPRTGRTGPTAAA